MDGHKLAISQIEPFRAYTDLFVQRIPRYAVKTGRSWTTKNKPLSDIPIAAHLLGKYAVAVLGKWYPEFSILDIDDRPRGTVDELRERLELDDKNSMLFTSESPDSYHVLLRPEYHEKPPTVRLLNNAFRSFCDLHHVEIYPQPGHAVRLPFGPRQHPLDIEYSGLGTWQDKLYWFQKLNEFDITAVKGQQFIFDFELPTKPALPTLTDDGQYLLEHGLQAPGSRHEAQFKVIYLLWRRNVPLDTTRELTFSWIRRKHNGFSKDIVHYPEAVRKEIERQTAHVYEKYELTRTFPDSTHNLFNGFISKPDMVEVMRISGASLPRMVFLFNLVKFYYPRRFRSYVGIHTDKLTEWSSSAYLKFLAELEDKGIVKRGGYYKPGLSAKTVKLEWPFKSANEAILYDGRSIETFEQTAKTVFQPAEFRELLGANGAKSRWSYAVTSRIWANTAL